MKTLVENISLEDLMKMLVESFWSRKPAGFYLIAINNQLD